MTNTKRCQYCGKEIALESVACIHCNGAIATKPGVAVPDYFAAVRSALSDRYEIVAEIGHGGNATVYQAIQKNLDRKIALKVLLPGLVNDAGYLERFHMEARAIAKLRHPNIVTIYDEGNVDGIHFMAMEFLEGKDLHKTIREKGCLSPRDAVDMAGCIAGALDYAHGYGIIHRDVKSSNIIMTSTRTAVLTDFGIAQSPGTNVSSRSGTLLGTPEFMSPEQAGGKPTGPGTDFYSLGVVLYHALSGKYPFQGDTPINTIHRILYDDPAPIESLVRIPAAVKQGVEKCLVKDPEKRVQSGRELMRILTTRSTTVTAPAGRNADTARLDADAPETGETRVPHTAPRPTGAHPPQRNRRKGTVLARVMMFAAAACLFFTGYVLWEHLPHTDAQAQPQTNAQAPAPLTARRLVPYVVGATQEEATKLLKREGFVVGAVRAVAVPDPGMRGRVDSQHPSRGTVAKPGAAIDLIIGE